MAVSFSREICAPIAIVRDELALIVAATNAKQIPGDVSDRWLGRVIGSVSEHSFRFAYRFVPNDQGVELWGNYSVVEPAVTRVTYRCGLRMSLDVIGLLLWLGFCALLVPSGGWFPWLAAGVGCLQFGWAYLRNHDMTAASDPAARHLLKCVRNALSQAEARYQATRNST